MNKNKLGEKIRELREKKGLGLREMAKIIDVSAAYLSKVETGKELSLPTEDKIIKIAEILKVPSDSLLRLAEKIDPELQKYMHEIQKVPEFLRTAKEKKLSDKEFEKLIDQIRKKKI